MIIQLIYVKKYSLIIMSDHNVFLLIINLFDLFCQLHSFLMTMHIIFIVLKGFKLLSVIFIYAPKSF